MSSDRKIAANRINGRKSRGPKTAAGKARASTNALKHGLSAVIHRNPILDQEIQQWARSICDEYANPLVAEQAAIVAETAVLRRRIGLERVAAIERARHEGALSVPDRDHGFGLPGSEFTADRLTFESHRDALEDLRRLERYERRIGARYKRALRAFIWTREQQARERQAREKQAQVAG